MALFIVIRSGMPSLLKSPTFTSNGDAFGIMNRHKERRHAAVFEEFEALVDASRFDGEPCRRCRH